MLDLHLARLAELAQTEGGVDCTSSQLARPLRHGPRYVQRRVRGTRRQSSAGYNFSIPGIPVSGNAALAQILVGGLSVEPADLRHHDADFTNLGDASIDPFHGFATAQRSSVEGWLTEHSTRIDITWETSKVSTASDRLMRGFCRAHRAAFSVRAAVGLSGAMFARAMNLRPSYQAGDRARPDVGPRHVAEIRDRGTSSFFSRCPSASTPPNGLPTSSTATRNRTPSSSGSSSHRRADLVPVSRHRPRHGWPIHGT